MKLVFWLYFKPHQIELMRLGTEKVFGEVKMREGNFGYLIISGKDETGMIDMKIINAIKHSSESGQTAKIEM